MKVNYFGYCLKHRETGHVSLFNISSILKGFCSYDNVKFKNSFRQNSENIYLIHQLGDTFLFLGTRSDEIIKKINKDNLSIEEINSLLQQNEKMGFTSYIIIKENYFGFGSSLFAPKVDKFINFINDLLVECKHGKWELCVSPLIYKATKQEAMNFSHLGRTSIQFNKESGLGKQLVSLFTSKFEDTFELGDIEVTFKPKDKTSNIKPVITNVINSKFYDGFDKLIVKAKSEAASILTDLYIIGNGTISDNIKTKEEVKIPGLLEQKISENAMLHEKVKEYLENEGFSKKEKFNKLNSYADVATWSSSLGNL